MKASLVTLPTFTATPTPTPVPPLPTVAPPSALAVASVRFCDSRFRLAVPPPLCAVRCRPSGNAALALLLATVMATAPATLTPLPESPLPLSEADALASVVLAVLPAALESVLVAFVSAAPFWLVTFLSTPFSCVPPAPASDSCSPPATLALARERLADTVLAEKVTLPPASMSRPVVASAVSVEMVNASEMPTPVSPDSVSPLASELTEPSCAASSVTTPVFCTAGSVKLPSVASVSLFDTETAIDGVTAVFPLLPASAALLDSLLDDAESLMSLAPVIEASSPT